MKQTALTRSTVYVLVDNLAFRRILLCVCRSFSTHILIAVTVYMHVG